MIAGSSAIVAILLREPGHDELAMAIADAPVVGIGAPTLAETGIVVAARLGVRGSTLLERVVQEGAWSRFPSAMRTGVKRFARSAASARGGIPRRSTSATA